MRLRAVTLQTGTALCAWCWLALTLPGAALLWTGGDGCVGGPAGDAPLPCFSWMHHHCSVGEECPTALSLALLYHFLFNGGF